MTDLTALILGASVRAALFSARRAAIVCSGGDLFADLDTAPLGDVQAIRAYPRDFFGLIQQSSAQGWLYTGALENYPDLVDQMALLKPLWGNRGPVLRQVRDPWQVQAVSARHGIPYPELKRTKDELPRGETWLQKPFASAGGMGIRKIVPAVSSSSPGHEKNIASPTKQIQKPTHYLQKFVPGESCSAVFLAGGDRSVFLGATRQWIGAPWCGAKGFLYCGSSGPLSLSESLQTQFRNLGEIFAREFSLTGLFGIDAVNNAAISAAGDVDDRIVPIEINPRFPASVEILERVGNFSAIQWHLEACRDATLPAEPSYSSHACAGKIVYYVREELEVGESLREWIAQRCGTFPRPLVADIPRLGTTLRAGSPLLTLLADGTSLPDVEQNLQRQAQSLDELLLANQRPQHVPRDA